ncbi:MAG: hypothetical protein RL757_3222 [Bacteroidota bacterium]|jgi:hypothetical protein
MKKVFTFLVIFCSVQFAQSQVLDTISMGAGYAQQVWYNLKNDTEWKSPRANWDLAFSVEARNATVQANPLVKVYRPRLAIANVTATLDTLTLLDSDLLYNTDTAWTFGALNSTRNATNVFDEGWGLYNIVSHNVIGDSVFVLKFPNGAWKKFWIERLAVDTVYTIKYSNLDNSNTVTKTLRKADFANQKFAYFNFANETFIQREPNKANWDLTFTQYYSLIPVPSTPNIFAYYILTGTLGNTGVKLAKVVGDSAARNYRAATPKTEINVIGADWKSFSPATNQWTIAQNTYFVQTLDSVIHRLVFTGFGGSANGNFIFKRQKLGTVAVTELPNGTKARLAVAPNPATDGNITILYDLGRNGSKNATLSLSDMSGRVVFQQNLPALEGGLNQWTLPQIGLSTGLYIATIRTESFIINEKLMVR